LQAFTNKTTESLQIIWHKNGQLSSYVINPNENSPPVRVGMRVISNLTFASVKGRLDK